MNYKALFLDIDGTILKTDHSYDPSTIEAIDIVKGKGIEVFLATGRPIHEIGPLAKELNIDSFIGYNGACAIYKNEVIVQSNIERSVIERFLNIHDAYGHEMALFTNQANYYTHLSSPLTKQFIQGLDLTFNEDWTNDVSDQILSVAVLNVKDGENKYYEFEPDIQLKEFNLKGFENCFDVIRKKVNKGSSIKQLLQKLHISPAEAIAFGDGLNDKEMLQITGASFAMGNAHPELFEYANYRTTSVEESGIYNGLNMLGLV